jgi:hypothetical protein
MAAVSLRPRVDLMIDGVWRDITSDVRDTGAKITRGRADEQTSTGPSRAALVIDNRTGNYSPRNPLGDHFGKIGRNSSIRIVTEQVWDDFGRTSASTWGTSDAGLAWSKAGGADADYTVGSGAGSISVGAVNAIRETFLAGVSRADVTVSAHVRAGVVATGARIDQAVYARRVDASNYYMAVCRFNTDSTIDLLMYKRVAGTTTLLVFDLNTGLTYTAASWFGIELQCYGSTLTARVWSVDDPSLGSTTVEVEDTALTAAGAAGVRSFLDALNTNTLPLVTRYDRFRVDDVRMVGEVASWPARWDVTGRNVWIPIEAAGILRRLGQGSKPLRSALYRSTLAGFDDELGPPLSYWPLEDPDGSTSAVSGVDDGQPMTVASSIEFANSTGPAGSDSLPSIHGGYLSGPVEYTSNGNGWELSFWVKITTSDATATSYPIRWDQIGSSAYRYWTVRGSTPANTVSVICYGTTGTVSAVGAQVSADIHDGEWHHISVEAELTDTNEVTTTLRVDGASDVDVATPVQLARVRHATLPRHDASPTNVSTMHVGHVTFWSGNTGLAPQALAAGLGHAGETAGARIARLCSEEGVPLVLVGTEADTAAVGAQRVASLLELIHDAVEADQGLLYEPRHVLGLAYRTRADMLNQTPAVELDYDAGHIAPPFEPVEDDLGIRNDVTAVRRTGGSGRVVEDQGPLSTSPPPVGIGVYDEQITVDVHDPDQCLDVAGWRVHLGTWDEARFPSVTVELRRPEFTTDAALTIAAATADLGDVLSIDNLPSWLPPGPMLLMTQGQTEVIGTYLHSITWNCTPGEPYTVAVWDDADALWDTRYSTLAADFDAGSDTSMSVATETGRIVWVTGAVDFDVTVGGAQIHVDSIAGATSPQTFTVDAAALNGVVKTVPAGTQVRLWRPARYS